MRVALLTTDNRDAWRRYGEVVPRFGPAPTALLEGLARLPSLEVHVVSCTQQPMRSPEKLAESIYFHSVHVTKLGWMRTFYQGCIRATRGKLREISPDIVHGQGTERDCSISAVLSGFPNVLTIHGNMAALARQFKARPASFHWLAGMLENWTLPRTSGVFCNSEYTRSLVRPRNSQTWEVPNALRSPFFSAVPDHKSGQPVRLLNIGTITPRKRQLELLNVCSNLYRKGLKFKMEFLGETSGKDPYSRSFLEAIARPEVSAYAGFSGFKESERELVELFDQANGCVHFPSEEAFGLVAAEALARNLRLFGSNLGGIADISRGVEGAELFASDDWTGLENGLARWMRDGSPRPLTAANVMRDRYHPLVIAQKHIQIYEEVLTESAKRNKFKRK